MKATDSPPDTANAMDDEFDGSSLDSKWTWANQGAHADITVDGVGYARMILDSEAAVDVHSLLQSAPSSPWTIRAKVQTDYKNTVGGGAVQSFGLVAHTDNGGGFPNRFTTFTSRVSSTAAQLHIGRWDNVTTMPFAISSTDLPVGRPIYLEIDFDGTTIVYSYSLSGFDEGFVVLGTEGINDWLFSVDDVGLCIFENNSEEMCGVCDWFRRVA